MNVLRAIAAVFVGYLAMFIVIAVSFTALQFGLGTDKVFKPGLYEVSTTFIASALVVSAIAAVLGGFVCALIAKTATPHKVLAVLVLAFGLLTAVINMNKADPGPRTGDVSPFDAAQKAKQPSWYAFTVAIVGGAGTFIGGNLRKRKPAV